MCFFLPQKLQMIVNRDEKSFYGIFVKAFLRELLNSRFFDDKEDTLTQISLGCIFRGKI